MRSARSARCSSRLLLPLALALWAVCSQQEAGSQLWVVQARAAARGPPLSSQRAGRSLQQASSPSPAPARAPAPPPAGTGVHWSVLRQSHGGRVRWEPAASVDSSAATRNLAFISVPHAVVLGGTLSTSQQPSEAACAAACDAASACSMYNFCPYPPANPTNSSCKMDTAQTLGPPGTCSLLQQTAIQSPSIMPLLGNGSGLLTTAGAPLVPELAGAPMAVDGFSGVLGCTIFGAGNFPCPESFQENACALVGDVEELAAACDAKPNCTAYSYITGAAVLLRAASNAGRDTSRIGALKAIQSVLKPWQLAWTRYAITYYKEGQVELASAGSPPAEPAAPVTPAAATPAGAGSGITSASTDPSPGTGNITWSVLLRPQAELRAVAGGGLVIAALQLYLPGSPLSGMSIERSFDDCVHRCATYPDCKSLMYCPATQPAGCFVGGLGVSITPPGGCSMLYEEGVAQSNSVPILATGPSLTLVAGIPVTARANLTLPGYRQHLAQALWGFYDMTCPGSLRENYCRLAGTLEEMADACNRNPNCMAFTWREAPFGRAANGSATGVLKAGGQIDPSRINWNPGLSLFVKESVPLPDAAPLHLAPPPDPPAPTPYQQQQQQQQGANSTTAATAAAGGGLGAGAIAGIAVGAAVAAAVMLAATLALRRHTRHAAPGLKVLPMHPKRTASGVDGTEVELGIAVGGSPTAGRLTTPRQRGSPPRVAMHAAPVPGTVPPVGGTGSGGAASLQGLPHSRSRQHLEGGSSSSRQQLVNSGSSTSSAEHGRHTSGRLPAEGSTGTSGSAATQGISPQSPTAAAGPVAGPRALDWASDILAQSSPQWQDCIVDESEIEYLLGPDGKPISLGAGAYGHVYKVLLGGHTQCAAKIVSWHGNQRSQLHFVQEAAMLRRLRHPNVVAFMGVVVSEERGILLMEYCPGKDLDACMHLRSRINGERLFDWYNRGRKVALDVASGLAYLHHSRVLHLDLKPGNILLGRDGTAKLGDVGFSRMMSRTHLSLDGFGTFDWAAPELLMGQGATDKTDIFSLGVILWEVCTGLRPRRGQLTPLRVPEHCPSEVAALQRACVSADPARRPTAAAVLGLLMGLPVTRRPSLPLPGTVSGPGTPPPAGRQSADRAVQLMMHLEYGQAQEQQQVGQETGSQRGQEPGRRQEGQETKQAVASVHMQEQAQPEAGSPASDANAAGQGSAEAASPTAAGATVAEMLAPLSQAGAAELQAASSLPSSLPSLPSWLGEAMPTSPAGTLSPHTNSFVSGDG